MAFGEFAGLEEFQSPELRRRAGLQLHYSKGEAVFRLANMGTPFTDTGKQ